MNKTCKEEIMDILMRYINPVVTLDEGKTNVHLDYNTTREKLSALITAREEQLVEKIEKLPKMQHGYASENPIPTWIKLNDAIQLIREGDNGNE